MYSLKEFWQIRNLPVPEGEWDGNVICLETNAEWSFGANQTHGFLSCYSIRLSREASLPYYIIIAN